MPRFVKWSKKLRDQEYWTILRTSPTSFLVRFGAFRGALKGKGHEHATPEEAQAAYDAAIAKQAKAKGWLRIEVPDVPTTVGDKQRYAAGLFEWELVVRDETSLETTDFRDGKPAGGVICQCANTLERDGTAELLIAEKLSTGYVRVDGGRTPEPSRFMTTGFFESA